MRTFAHRQDQFQRHASSDLARPNVAKSAPSHPTHTHAAEASTPKLTISKSGDEHEREADRVSEQVLEMREPQTRGACACGGGCPKCQAGHAGRGSEGLQMKSVRAGDTGHVAPPIVHEALRSAGRPLDSTAASFFSARFGHDFGGVRVHTDERSAESAEALGARAYTVGRDLVFGRGQYEPHTDGGRRLLAHELAHVVQQSSSANMSAQPFVQRACLPDKDCATPAGEPRAGTAKQFGEEMEQKEDTARAEKLKQTAQVAQSTGHGKRAVETEKLFQEQLPDLRKLVHSVFIDDTLPVDADAGRTNCLAWVGENLKQPGADKSAFAGARPDSSCIRVPKKLEDNAALYNNSNEAQREALQVSLKWFILRVLTHETTHVRFNKENIAFPEKQGCTKEKLNKELGELASVISEFPIVKGLPDDLRKAWAESHLKDPRQIAKPGESIFGSIFDIRCSCECVEADALIKAAFDVASASWSAADKRAFHIYMKQGTGKDYGVYWPIEPAPLAGQVGRHEVTLSAGASLSGSDPLLTAMGTYRFVLSRLAEGRVQWTVGGQAVLNNLADKLQEPEPRPELGVLTGLQFVQRPRVTEKTFGGLIGRVETGFGVGEFSLKPATPEGATTEWATDYILQVSGGVQFYLRRVTDMRPASLELTYRRADPIGSEAQTVQTLALTFSVFR
ncbi:MAG TPA: DUF4157 domain-containing protein [Pyrinomonadaceae bacterium]|nr:DUF4157 domain-containing protein [Pyrinomonadaceae bacterium]